MAHRAPSPMSSPMLRTKEPRAGAGVSPMPQSRSPSPLPREVRRSDGRMTQDVLHQSLPTRPGAGRLSTWSSQEDPNITRAGQSFAFPQHPPQNPATALQMELKGLRSSLEKTNQQAVLLAGERDRIGQPSQQLQQDDVSRAMFAGQHSDQAASIQQLKGEVDMLRKQLLTLCELEDVGSRSNSIEELRTAVATHHQSAHSEIKILMHDMGSLRQDLRFVQELVVSQKSNIDAEIKQLRLDLESRFSQQEMQAKLRHVETQKLNEFSVQKESNSSLADDVQRLARSIEELRSHHGTLRTALESELENLQHVLEEKQLQAGSATESKFIELRSSLQEHRKEALGTWSKFQNEIDRVQKRQSEDCLEVVNKSNELLMQTQSDMNSLRELFDRSATQKDYNAPHESLAMVRSLQAEVENLRQKHDSLGTDPTKQDPSVALQTQAELREIRGALQQQQALQDQAALAQQIAKQAQRLEVEAVQQQLKDQKARLDTLGSTSKSLQDQVGDLSDYTKQGLASVQQLTTQPVLAATPVATGQDGEVNALRTELDALKRQMSMQQSMQDAQVAKKAGTLQERLHEAVGTEREARLQESIEMRSLIKSLYEETGRLARQLKADNVDPSSPGSGPGLPAHSSTSDSFKHIDVTKFIGVANSDPSTASRHSV